MKLTVLVLAGLLTFACPASAQGGFKLRHLEYEFEDDRLVTVVDYERTGPGSVEFFRILQSKEQVSEIRKIVPSTHQFLSPKSKLAREYMKSAELARRLLYSGKYPTRKKRRG